MRSDLFTHEMTHTSPLFGRVEDVQVIFEGTDAGTDGKKIVLPQLKGGIDIEPGEVHVMRGFVDHEAGHLRHSDMPLIMDKYDRYLREGRTLAKELHNACEDVWLERRVMAEYPGSEVNLRATTEAVSQMTLDNIEDNPKAEAMLAEPTFIMPVAITWEGRQHYGGKLNRDLLAKLPDAIAERLPAIIEDILKAESTSDIFEISERLERELVEDWERRGKPDPTEGEGEGTGPGGGEGQKSGGTRGGESSGSGKAEGGGEGQKSGGKGEPEVGEVTIKPEGITTSGTEGLKQPKVMVTKDHADAVEDLMQRIGGKAEGDAYVALNQHMDRWIKPGMTGNEIGQWLDHSNGISKYEDIVRRESGTINVVRATMERVLLSQLKRDWDYGREDGKLDSRRLPAVVAGRVNVFKQRQARKELDTAVSIVVDMSGSMRLDRTSIGKSRINIATETIIALGEAMSRLGVPFAVTGFTQPFTYSKYEGGKALAVEPPSEAKVGAIARYMPIWMVEVKPFSQSLFAARKALGNMYNLHIDHNIDGESLLYAYDMLAKRPETRKVMIVLSDGMPECDGYNQAALYKHTKDSVSWIASRGVDIVAIGIQTEAVENFYEHFVVVNDLKHLAEEGIAVLRDVLLKGVNERAA